MKPEEIYNKYCNVEYGYFDKNNNRLYHINDGFLKKFRLQSVSHIEETNVGVCWETVELLRYYLEENGYECKSYFFVIPKDKFYTHSIITYKINNKYYWMECSLQELKGIREYNSFKELVFDLLDHYNLVTQKEDFNYEDIKIFEYSKPKDKISCLQYFYHCFSSKNITNEYIPQYLKNIAQNNN